MILFRNSCESSNVQLKRPCPSEMKFICLTLILISGITDSRSEHYEVVGPANAIIAVAGEDVILPCSVKPSISIVDMRVEWFRSDLKDSQLVHLYENQEDRNKEQIESYSGRTELKHQDLQRGDASLKLSLVRVSDEGLYKCFIQSKSWSDDATVNVRVEVRGRPPVITVDGFDHSGGLHLQCESEGWYPEPVLEWLDQEGVSLSPETRQTQRKTKGLSVKQTIIVHHRDDKIHCRVRLRHYVLETVIITTSNMFLSWRTMVILISFCVVLNAVAGILIVVFVRKYRAHSKLQDEKMEMQDAHYQLENAKRRMQIERNELHDEKIRLKQEHNQLLNEKRRIQQANDQLQNAQRRIQHVNVILDADTAHPRLILTDDGKQVKYGNTQTKGVDDKKERFNKYLGILGKEGFSSGCFYFEVQVKGQTQWDLGVAGESANRKERIVLSPENGYWTVSLEYGKYWAHESSYVFLSLSPKPQRVGVFVDYEKGLISFYDVETSSLIYSFTGQTFNEKLYPFVSLGYLWNENYTPLIICDDYY